MLISILLFIFQIFCHLYSFSQIWSQNLKFFKLTEIWYRGRLPYAYFDFNVYFFKILFIHSFREKLVPKSEVLQIDWNLVDYHILISIVMFIFSKFLWFIFSLGKFGPTKSDVRQIKWNLVQGYIVYAYFDFNIYFFKILFIHIFLANLIPKCEVLQIDWNLVHR